MRVCILHSAKKMCINWDMQYHWNRLPEILAEQPGLFGWQVLVVWKNSYLKSVYPERFLFLLCSDNKTKYWGTYRYIYTWIICNIVTITTVVHMLPPQQSGHYWAVQVYTVYTCTAGLVLHNWFDWCTLCPGIKCNTLPNWQGRVVLKSQHKISSGTRKYHHYTIKLFLTIYRHYFDRKLFCGWIS